MGGYVRGILFRLLLGGGDGFADAAYFEVEIGQAVLKVARSGVGTEGKLVFLDGLGGVVGAAVVDGELFVKVSEAIVIIGGGVVRDLGERRGGGRRDLRENSMGGEQRCGKEESGRGEKGFAGTQGHVCGFLSRTR